MGGAPVKIGTLELGEDYEFQKRDWRVQRIGWAFFVVVVVAALAGGLGYGPVSHATAGGDPLKVRYERVARHHAPTNLTLELAPGAARSDGTATVVISREYVESIEIDSIVPEPESVAAGPEFVSYEFAVEDPDRRTSVLFNYRPVTKWSRRVEIGLGNGGPVVTIRQFVLP